MSALTPEQRTEWREEAADRLGTDRLADIRYGQARILALLDALDDAERERDEFREASFERGEAAERAEAALARVEALADEYDANENWRQWAIGSRIRAALTGPTETAEGVGTGAGEDAPRQDTGSARVTRSVDCPEDPAQAHPLRAASTGPTIDPLAAAWHDVTCPEGRECRSRFLHAMSGRAVKLPLVRRAVAEWLRSEDVREVAAHAAAIHDDYDGCFVREGDDECEPCSTARSWWRDRAAAALDAVAGLCGGEG